MTSKTGALAVDIASDKDLTAKLLGSAGLPVPAGHRSAPLAVPWTPPSGSATRSSSSRSTATTDEGHASTCSPRARSRRPSTARAESKRGTVIVESYVTGQDYRCLIVGGRMQAIAERVPAHVVGDGEHTVHQLVEATNADPRRDVGHEKVLTKIGSTPPPRRCWPARVPLDSVPAVVRW